MATTTDHRISNSQHKTSVHGQFSDAGEQILCEIEIRSSVKLAYLV